MKNYLNIIIVACCMVACSLHALQQVASKPTLVTFNEQASKIFEQSPARWVSFLKEQLAKELPDSRELKTQLELLQHQIADNEVLLTKKETKETERKKISEELDLYRQKQKTLHEYIAQLTEHRNNLDTLGNLFLDRGQDLYSIAATLKELLMPNQAKLPSRLKALLVLLHVGENPEDWLDLLRKQLNNYSVGPVELDMSYLLLERYHTLEPILFSLCKAMLWLNTESLSPNFQDLLIRMRLHKSDVAARSGDGDKFSLLREEKLHRAQKLIDRAVDANLEEFCQIVTTVKATSPEERVHFVHQFLKNDNIRPSTAREKLDHLAEEFTAYINDNNVFPALAECLELHKNKLTDSLQKLKTNVQYAVIGAIEEVKRTRAASKNEMSVPPAVKKAPPLVKKAPPLVKKAPPLVKKAPSIEKQPAAITFSEHASKIFEQSSDKWVSFLKEQLAVEIPSADELGKMGGQLELLKRQIESNEAQVANKDTKATERKAISEELEGLRREQKALHEDLGQLTERRNNLDTLGGLFLAHDQELKPITGTLKELLVPNKTKLPSRLKALLVLVHLGGNPEDWLDPLKKQLNSSSWPEEMDLSYLLIERYHTLDPIIFSLCKAILWLNKDKLSANFHEVLRRMRLHESSADSGPELSRAQSITGLLGRKRQDVKNNVLEMAENAVEAGEDEFRQIVVKVKAFFPEERVSFLHQFLNNDDVNAANEQEKLDHLAEVFTAYANDSTVFPALAECLELHNDKLTARLQKLKSDVQTVVINAIEEAKKTCAASAKAAPTSPVLKKAPPVGKPASSPKVPVKQEIDGAASVKKIHDPLVEALLKEVSLKAEEMAAQMKELKENYIPLASLDRSNLKEKVLYDVLMNRIEATALLKLNDEKRLSLIVLLSEVEILRATIEKAQAALMQLQAGLSLLTQRLSNEKIDKIDSEDLKKREQTRKKIQERIEQLEQMVETKKADFKAKIAALKLQIEKLTKEKDEAERPDRLKRQNEAKGAAEGTLKGTFDRESGKSQADRTKEIEEIHSKALGALARTGEDPVAMLNYLRQCLAIESLVKEELDNVACLLLECWKQLEPFVPQCFSTRDTVLCAVLRAMLWLNREKLSQQMALSERLKQVEHRVQLKILRRDTVCRTQNQRDAVEKKIKDLVAEAISAEPGEFKKIVRKIMTDKNREGLDEYCAEGRVSFLHHFLKKAVEGQKNLPKNLDHLAEVFTPYATDISYFPVLAECLELHNAKLTDSLQKLKAEAQQSVARAFVKPTEDVEQAPADDRVLPPLPPKRDEAGSPSTQLGSAGVGPKKGANDSLGQEDSTPPAPPRSSENLHLVEGTEEYEQELRKQERIAAEEAERKRVREEQERVKAERLKKELEQARIKVEQERAQKEAADRAQAEQERKAQEELRSQEARAKEEQEKAKREAELAEKLRNDLNALKKQQQEKQEREKRDAEQLAKQQKEAEEQERRERQAEQQRKEAAAIKQKQEEEQKRTKQEADRLEQQKKEEAELNGKAGIFSLRNISAVATLAIGGALWKYIKSHKSFDNGSDNPLIVRIASILVGVQNNTSKLRELFADLKRDLTTITRGPVLVSETARETRQKFDELDFTALTSELQKFATQSDDASKAQWIEKVVKPYGTLINELCEQVNDVFAGIAASKAKLYYLDRQETAPWNKPTVKRENDLAEVRDTINAMKQYFEAINKSYELNPVSNQTRIA